jgi:Ni/Co efflux regulator RcnB
MRKLVFILCLAATPAAAQVIIQTPNSEQHDRNDRDRDRARGDRHEDRRQNFKNDHREQRNYDDEEDVTLVGFGWQHGHGSTVNRYPPPSNGR